MKRFWVCVMGPVDGDDLPEYGADSSMRVAAQKAMLSMTGEMDFDCWSGFVTDNEAAVALRGLFGEGSPSKP